MSNLELYDYGRKIYRRPRMGLFGSGGVGSHIGIFAGQAGFDLAIVDPDTVKPENHTFPAWALGEYKTETVKSLLDRTTDVKVTSLPYAIEDLYEDELEELFTGSDVVVCAIDVPDSRLFFNDAQLRYAETRPVIVAGTYPLRATEEYGAGRVFLFWKRDVYRPIGCVVCGMGTTPGTRQYHSPELVTAGAQLVGMFSTWLATLMVRGEFTHRGGRGFWVRHARDIGNYPVHPDPKEERCPVCGFDEAEFLRWEPAHRLTRRRVININDLS